MIVFINTKLLIFPFYLYAAKRLHEYTTSLLCTTIITCLIKQQIAFIYAHAVHILKIYARYFKSDRN